MFIDAILLPAKAIRASDIHKNSDDQIIFVISGVFINPRKT